MKLCFLWPAVFRKPCSFLLRRCPAKGKGHLTIPLQHGFKGVIIERRHRLPVILFNKALYIFLPHPVDVQEKVLNPAGKVIKITIKEHGVKVIWYMFRVREAFGKKGIAVAVECLYHATTKEVLQGGNGYNVCFPQPGSIVIKIVNITEVYYFILELLTGIEEDFGFLCKTLT